MSRASAAISSPTSRTWSIGTLQFSLPTGFAERQLGDEVEVRQDRSCVRCGLDEVDQLGQLRQPAQQPVVEDGAVVTALHELAGAGKEVRDVGHLDRQRRHSQHPVLDQVPILAERHRK